MDTRVGSEFHAFRVQPQERDVVVVGIRAVPLVFDHSQHFEVHVFRLLRVAAIVFQEPNADVLAFESVSTKNVCEPDSVNGFGASSSVSRNNESRSNPRVIDGKDDECRGRRASAYGGEH